MSQSQLLPNISSDHELEVLSHIHRNHAVKQRDIAHAIGLSLGMTNAILKRLAAKGFIAMRRVNARTIHYLVTPAGIDLIARRSYRYLRRTVGHVVRYKERVLEILAAASAAPPAGRGVTSVVLVGESDLDFLVEWCAEKAGLAFCRGPAPRDSGGSFVIAAEGIPRGGSVQGPRWDLHVADLVTGTAGERVERDEP